MVGNILAIGSFFGFLLYHQRKIKDAVNSYSPNSNGMFNN